MNANSNAILLLAALLALNGLGTIRIADASKSSILDDLGSMSRQPFDLFSNHTSRPSISTVNQFVHFLPYGDAANDESFHEFRWRDSQIDLDFFLPILGFRFNYTFLSPNGYIAFSYPQHIQPPYVFPVPKWPEAIDPSLIAVYMKPNSNMTFQNTSLNSNIWYRVISRPFGPRRLNRFSASCCKGRTRNVYELDDITNLIRNDANGGAGFTADYALVVTWENVGKSWENGSLNTFQVVLATDEIITYIIFNYGQLCVPPEPGLMGSCGKASAVVGINAGNGTGFYELPHTNPFDLVRYGNTGAAAGRWIYRIDEKFVNLGCKNDSIGDLMLSPEGGSMLGGFNVNVSGPCLRASHRVKLQIAGTTIGCKKLSMTKARCPVPIGFTFSTGSTTAKLSTDYGKTYPYFGKFNVYSPDNDWDALLINDPVYRNDSWDEINARNLTIRWHSMNVTAKPNEQVDISVWTAELLDGIFRLKQLGTIAETIPNTGVYIFNPSMLPSSYDVSSTRPYGILQVRVSSNWIEDDSSMGVQWTRLTPIGWLGRSVFESKFGKEWPTKLCREWGKDDDIFTSFWDELDEDQPCPCTLDQAASDIGRFIPQNNCDMNGDSSCPYTRGAFHCIISTKSHWSWASQQCCYDTDGWLMFSQDYEHDQTYLRFYSAGVMQRNHPHGGYPYVGDPYVPTLSNYYHDLIPYQLCCRWSNNCHEFYQRRWTSTCKAYQPAVAGFAFGDPHFITYDGLSYTFNGKGYYMLTMYRSPKVNFMVQVRMEQPTKTIWNERVNATVITGVAMQDTKSSVVEIYARKEFRRWRYRMDVFVDGQQVFFDKSSKKFQHFKGGLIYSPARNMNQSDIRISFANGLGVRVRESFGMLDVMVSLPPRFNETAPGVGAKSSEFTTPFSKCATHIRTLGLLGTYNNDTGDDLITPDCSILMIDKQMPSELSIFKSFGEKWRIDGTVHQILFQPNKRPLYNSVDFYQPDFMPMVDIQGNISLVASLIRTKYACRGHRSCAYDYVITGRRDIAAQTLKIDEESSDIKERGERPTISCGPLLKTPNIIKYPPGNNYLDGVTITFTCKAGRYQQGSQRRTCINGTWSDGRLAWCTKGQIPTEEEIDNYYAYLEKFPNRTGTEPRRSSHREEIFPPSSCKTSEKRQMDLCLKDVKETFLNATNNSAFYQELNPRAVINLFPGQSVSPYFQYITFKSDQENGISINMIRQNIDKVMTLLDIVCDISDGFIECLEGETNITHCAPWIFRGKLLLKKVSCSERYRNLVQSQLACVLNVTFGETESNDELATCLINASRTINPTKDAAESLWVRNTGPKGADALCSTVNAMMDCVTPYVSQCGGYETVAEIKKWAIETLQAVLQIDTCDK